MKSRQILSLFLALLLILCCSACNFDSRSDSEFFAMDTVIAITAYGSNSEAAVEAAESEINSLDALLSVQNKESEIYRLNRDKSLAASADTLELIALARQVCELTDGAFDITTEPLSRAWGFYSGLENRVPPQSEIDTALESVGAEHIKIEDNIIFLDKNTSVDLGGIAKGYASARAARIMGDYGVTSALISLGGNVRTVGCKPDGSKWNVAVADPDDASGQIGTVSVSDSAVVTSGGYQRYFEENGQIYHHIIDTETGYPADSGLKSVTVVSEDDALADALSTALFVMGLEKSAELYGDNASLFGAIFVTDKNEIYVTDNLSDDFSSPNGFEVIKS